MAADTEIARSFSPETPMPGELVTVSLSAPPSFFGGIVEQLPEGFTFVETSHPQDGVKQYGQMVIFAITGEEMVQYTVRSPASGCGVIQGRWENIGTKASGDTPASVVAVAGTDPSHCTVPQHTPGFGAITAATACSGAAIIILTRTVKR
jgi:hypothetical protein